MSEACSPSRTIIFLLCHVKSVGAFVRPASVVDQYVEAAELGNSTAYEAFPVCCSGHICFNEDAFGSSGT